MIKASVKHDTSGTNQPWNIFENRFSGIGKFSVAVNPRIETAPGSCDDSVDEIHQPKHLKEHCKFAVIFVSEHFNVPISEMMSKTRANAHAASARQVAAYVAHTTLSISYAHVAEFFHRDRTTISHACKTIEDRRDDRLFDAKLCMVENLVGEAVRFILCHEDEFATPPDSITSLGENGQ